MTKLVQLFIHSGEHQRHQTRCQHYSCADGYCLSGVPAETVSWMRTEPTIGATSEEFGAKSADSVAAVYKEYFAAPSLRTAFGFSGLTLQVMLPRDCHSLSAPFLARKATSIITGDSPNNSRCAEPTPGGCDSQPVSQMDAAPPGPHSRCAGTSGAAGTRYRRVPRVRAALGCRVEPRCRNEESSMT